MVRALDGKVAVITGSGSGIGRVTALAMAKEGAMVVVSDILARNSDKVASEITNAGGRAISISGDISDFDFADKLMTAAAEKFGRIDILHNNAGISRPAPIQDLAEKDWDIVVAVNLKGAFNCTRHAAPHMIRQRWGRIINTSSGARRGSVGSGAYSATKAGIIGLTGSTARDLKPFCITCNAYLPTASMTGLSANKDQKTLDWLKVAHKRGQFTREQYDALTNPPATEKIPAFLMYLCTEEARGITGEVFDIFGDVISIYSESAKRTSIFKADGWSVEDLKKVVPTTLLSPQN